MGHDVEPPAGIDMIIVTGSITCRPEDLDEVLRHSLEHVRRSRLEPGCVLHSVHQDVEDPNRVVFIEHWVDEPALMAHFAVPASGDFVKTVTALGASTSIEIYEATPVGPA